MFHTVPVVMFHTFLTVQCYLRCLSLCFIKSSIRGKCPEPHRCPDSSLRICCLHFSLSLSTVDIDRLLGSVKIFCKGTFKECLGFFLLKIKIKTTIKTV